MYEKKFEKFALEKFFFAKNWIENFEKFNFWKKKLSNCTFQHQTLIWNDFSFHMMYIMSVLVKNFQIFKDFCSESWEFFAIRWGYFGITFWKYYESKDGFQRFYWRIKNQNVIWDHLWWIHPTHPGFWIDLTKKIQLDKIVKNNWSAPVSLNNSIPLDLFPSEF